MSARGGRRKKGHGGAHNDERWLLTYADMITLLMALFIILWAISVVNDGKFEQLSKSLRDAFSGAVLTGSPSIIDGSSGGKIELVPTTAVAKGQTETSQRFDQRLANAQAIQELESLKELQEQVEAYAGSKGLSGKLTTSIDERGLVIRILPDGVLFDTGKADLKTSARPILDELVRLLQGLEGSNPVRVEGHTDSVPISTPEFPDNWTLSAARAYAVLHVIDEDGFDQTRLSFAGYADQRPLAGNDSEAGRAQNRRVEIVVVRQAVEQPAAGAEGNDVGLIEPVGIAPFGEEVVTP